MSIQEFHDDDGKILIGVAAWVILGLCNAAWIFFDGRKRGVQSSILDPLVIAAPIFSQFALAYYIATRPLKPGEIRKGPKWAVFLLTTLTLMILFPTLWLLAVLLYWRLHYGALSDEAREGLVFYGGMLALPLMCLWFLVIIILGIIIGISGVEEVGADDNSAI